MSCSNHKPHRVVGRYAPSPTGVLHLGNLRTALLAWLHARLQGGTFLLRMEDLDTPRMVQGSDAEILSDLEWLGIEWDGEVVYQSQRLPLYEQALDELTQQGKLYPCFCSRKDIQQAASAPHSSSGVYPGTCRSLSKADVVQRQQHKVPAIRLKVRGDLLVSCGDFVVRRADHLFAYQLAVVVDDLEQGISDVVRGNDLADCTPRQHYLAQLLCPERTPIHYVHVPLLLDDDGKRMSKRDGSMSASRYRHSHGVSSAEKMVGEFAYDLGLIDQNKAISAADLLHQIDLNSLFKAIDD